MCGAVLFWGTDFLGLSECSLCGSVLMLAGQVPVCDLSASAPQSVGLSWGEHKHCGAGSLSALHTPLLRARSYTDSSLNADCACVSHTVLSVKALRSSRMSA